MAQHIKACADDSEDLCSVPRTHLKKIIDYHRLSF